MSKATLVSIASFRPVMRPDAIAQLERVGINDLVLQGSVQVIGLQPIRARLGDRWPKKREHVWAHFEAVLRRQLPPHDLVVRVDDVHFLIAQTQERGASAQAICLRLAGELMQFFLGSASDSDIDVRNVTSADVDGLVCEPIDIGLFRAEYAQVAAAAPALSSPSSPQIKRKRFAVPTRLGRDLAIDLSLEPMWDLQNGLRMVGHYARTITHDRGAEQEISTARRAELQPADHLDLDLAALTEAIALRTRSPRSAGGLLVPVSYKVISNSSSRYALIHAVRALEPVARNSFAWELIDLEAGIPSDRLAEIVALLRPHCRGVVCRLPLTLNTAEQLRRAATTGSLMPEAGQPLTHKSLRRLATPLGTVRRVIPAFLLHQVPEDLLAEAIRTGASHCTLTSSNDGIAHD
jgi:hypothetical protein